MLDKKMVPSHSNITSSLLRLYLLPIGKDLFEWRYKGAVMYMLGTALVKPSFIIAGMIRVER